MNRRSFITALGLAPVAGVMAARGAMAAASTHTISLGLSDLDFGELKFGSAYLSPDDIVSLESRMFPIETIAKEFSLHSPSFLSHPAEDESVSAQFADDLAFLQADPEVVS